MVRPNPTALAERAVGVVLAALVVWLSLAGGTGPATVTISPVAAADAGSPTDVCDYQPTGRPPIRPGSTGPAVAQFQCDLNHGLDPSRHPPLPVDGTFGPATSSRLRVFQSCIGLAPDTVVGPQTWTAAQFAANAPSYLAC
jgi:lysozyme